jgi:hypothetical protein
VPAFEHTCCQPLGDQPDDSSIANPMFDEVDQPGLADLVEKGLDVAIKQLRKDWLSAASAATKQ